MSSNIKYRTFKNGDVPGLTEVWNTVKSRDYLPFETNFEVILTSVLFNPEDLIVAVDTEGTPSNPFVSEGKIVGFIHGGFGPLADNMTLDYSMGTIAMLRVVPREEREEIAQNLLDLLEKRFQSLGVKKISAGAVYPHAPFYMEQLSTGELHGIIETSTFAVELLKKNHYVVDSTYELYRIDMSGGLPAIPVRFVKLMNQYERKHQESTLESSNWWKCQAFRNVHRKTFYLIDYVTEEVIACTSSHSFTPTDATEEEKKVADENAIGTKSVYSTVHDLYVAPEYRHCGLAECLVDSVLRDLFAHGTKIVELQLPEVNRAARRTFQNLNFTHFTNSYVFCKVLD